MHLQAYRYTERALAALTIAGAHVVEIGSYNVNGSVRPLCEGCAFYIGVDSREGPGVDLVKRAQDLGIADVGQPADLVITTESIEHDAEPRGFVECAWRILKPGGILILTAAAPERQPHGCDGGAVLPGESYAPISRADLKEWLAEWEDVHIEHHPSQGDIYATARKPEAEKKPSKAKGD